jgi:vitellogenic carboxypeptidase-like protein
MKTLVALLALLAISSAIHTSSFWTKQGVDVKDGKFDKIYSEVLNVSTQCSNVNLNVEPYNYNGVVRSGYLSVNKGNSALGFIFYGRENTTQADLVNYPIVFWLNGGPGSSSQLGNFFELGPYHLKTANLAPYEIVKNEHAWTKDYSIVFVDQPVGTGISYADETVKDVYCTSQKCVADDFYVALKELYTNPQGCFNQLNIKPDQKFVIFGESYGGKYAPAIG